MSLFEIPKRAQKNDDIAIAKKSKVASQSVTVKSGGGLLGRIAEIKNRLNDLLGSHTNDYQLIETVKDLDDYVSYCIKNNIVALDTETTGLNPMLDSIVGFSLYTPGKKAIYVPLNHISVITGERLDWQLSENDVRPILQRLVDSETRIILFNADFDTRVLRHQIGVYITCYWDCYLAMRLMNENEEENKLKPLHQKYVLNDAEDEFSFGELFKGITFDKIPPNPGFLYAAHDAKITYELYEFQKPYLTPGTEECDSRSLQDVAWVMRNIEMPCVNVVADMEDTGVLLDLDYSETLSKKYNALLEERRQKFYDVCDEYADKIDGYRNANPGSKLDNPINISSPMQIAILLYDIFEFESPDKKKPRGTGEEIISTFKHPICEAILAYREVEKLISTYIDKLPACINPKDGRIHGKFNQYGADTGRFSSQDPNLQNIPSHNTDIRKMFVATPGYVLMSSDYSQQEPKVMTQMCQDPKMVKAYQDGKDLYAEIAALSFNTTYEECLEFRPDGTTNKAGKARRSQAKSILLGVLYGRGVPSIAEQLGVSAEKAQSIKDSVFKGFPAIPKFEKDSLDMAYENGFVTTLWGRKRRLPDLQLEEYEFKWKDGAPPDDDVLDFDAEETERDIPIERKKYYLRRLAQARFGQKRKIFEEANKEGIWIVDNNEKIARAQRQCVNARIQGSAADMTKLAMILIRNDELMNEWGFRLLIQVHDELIGECPIEHAKECKERFSFLMGEAAKGKLSIPINCDVTVTKEWYGKEVEV